MSKKDLIRKIETLEVKDRLMEQKVDRIIEDRAEFERAFKASGIIEELNFLEGRTLGMRRVGKELDLILNELGKEVKVTERERHFELVDIEKEN
ncbi:MAG: hypothetical protein PF495_11725 [Spirochaetales bacterium]|nr:hypothetical protein [Spirochaetales bacterium]